MHMQFASGVLPTIQNTIWEKKMMMKITETTVFQIIMSKTECIILHMYLNCYLDDDFQGTQKIYGIQLSRFTSTMYI